MDIQSAIVGVVVAACAVHALVTFAPAAARRRVASMLLRLPMLRGNARLARASAASGGCGCDGCDRAPRPATKRKVIPLRRVG